MLIQWIEKRTAASADPRSAMGKAASVVGIAVNMFLVAGIIVTALAISLYSFPGLFVLLVHAFRPSRTLLWIGLSRCE